MRVCRRSYSLVPRVSSSVASNMQILRARSYLYPFPCGQYSPRFHSILNGMDYNPKCKGDVVIDLFMHLE